MNVTKQTIEDAYHRLEDVVVKTPLEFHESLSKTYDAKIFLKREDMQLVRSYKLRGAYNKISQLSNDERTKGIVCASAGNHAQGVAFSCNKLKTKGTIYMPKNTPRQKIERVRMLGEDMITIVLEGDTFDASFKAAEKYLREQGGVLVHPFDDKDVIIGQGTVGVEIVAALPDTEVLVVPVGGGGLIAGLGTYAKETNSDITVVGVEPAGAASMDAALKQGRVVTLEKINKFVDGAAVQAVGSNNFTVAKDVIDAMVVVPEDKVCVDMISLYQRDGIITEPAGALSVAALESVRDTIKGKTVVCVISGGNNDVSRYPEILERSLVYLGLKHYFIIEFPQRPGALRSFLDDVLGETDDITFFEYVKKNNREIGPALVGFELARQSDLDPLVVRMKSLGFSFHHVAPDSALFQFVI